MYLLLTLGEYQKHNPHLAILDWKSKQIVDTYSYFSKEFPEIRSNSFRGGTLYNGLFYVCTFNEVLAIEVKTWKIHNNISFPTFNDLHDVFVDKSGIWVCCTGLECVERYSHDLDLVQRFNIGETDIWERFKKKTDYRLCEIDKRTIPRLHHINNVVNVDDEILVTHGKSESVRTIGGRVIIDGLPGMPHDGFIFNTEFYLTTVKGFIVAFRVGTWQRTRLYDLNKCYEEDEALGWCRGLAVEESGMFVGFTKFRPSKSIDYIRWIKQKPHELNTRVTRYSFTSNSLVDEFVLESRPGSTILLYGIYPLGENKEVPQSSG